WASRSCCRRRSSTCASGSRRRSRRCRTRASAPRRSDRFGPASPGVSADSPELHHRPRPSEGEPEGAIALMHGRGTDEHDLAPLIDALDPERRLVGATPRGPLALPPGGAHWYIVREVGFPDTETFMASLAELSAFVDA